MIVRINLRRDLPKLERALPRLLNNMGGACLYDQPCAVGVMVPAKKRHELDSVDLDDTQIDTLVNHGYVQGLDGRQTILLRKLQVAFDNADGDGLRRVTKQLLREYGPASAMSAGTDETAQQAQGDSPPARAEGDAQPYPDPSPPHSDRSSK